MRDITISVTCHAHHELRSAIQYARLSSWMCLVDLTPAVLMMSLRYGRVTESSLVTAHT